MKIQIRTKEDLAKLLNEGVSAAWRINKERLNKITDVEIYNFSGNARIVGAFDRDNTKVLDNGRVAVAFTNAEIEPCDFKWVGQNPIKYKSGNNEEVEFMEDEDDTSDVNDIDVSNQSLYEVCANYSDKKPELATLLKEVVFEKTIQGKNHNFNLRDVIGQVNRTFGELCWSADNEPSDNMESLEYYSSQWGEMLEKLSEEATQSGEYRTLGEYINERYQPFSDGERAEEFAIEMYDRGIEVAASIDDILWFSKAAICGEYFENEDLVYKAGRKAINLAENKDDYLKICFDDNSFVTFDEDITKEVVEILQASEDKLNEAQLNMLKSDLEENGLDDLISGFEQKQL